MNIFKALLDCSNEFTKLSVQRARKDQIQGELDIEKVQKEEVMHEKHLTKEEQAAKDQEELRQEIENRFKNIVSFSSSNHLLVMFHDDAVCITSVYRNVS